MENITTDLLINNTAYTVEQLYTNSSYIIGNNQLQQMAYYNIVTNRLLWFTFVSLSICLVSYYFYNKNGRNNEVLYSSFLGSFFLVSTFLICFLAFKMNKWYILIFVIYTLEQYLRNSEKFYDYLLLKMSELFEND